MASKQKKAAILRCTNIKFEKKPKKDRKAATLIISYETASGSWTQKKVFEDVWKFIESTAKSHKKVLGKFVKNITKLKDEYLNKSKHENAFKLIRDIFNNIGKNKKILSNDSKISAFVGAKRDHLKDIKTAQKITTDNNNSNKKTKPAPLSLGGGGGDDNNNNNNDNKKNNKKEEEEEEEKKDQEKEEEIAMISKTESSIVRDQVIELQQEIDTLKRKHLADISSLKQENHNLKINNSTLRETNDAANEARTELEDKISRYEHELGKDQIGDDMAAIFHDEFTKIEDPAEKYYQQTKEQNKRIDELEKQVQDLTHLNGDLVTKLERAKYVADHLATEVTELTDPKWQELEEDYKEVEAELDEVTQVKERYEIEMAQTAKILDALELEAAEMRPHYQEYPNLIKTIEQQRDDINGINEKLSKLQEERDDFEDKFLEIKKKQSEMIPAEQYKSSIKSYKEQIKEIQQQQTKTEHEKQEIQKEFESQKQEMAEIKIKIGQLEADNDKLEKGGGRDINLDIKLDLESDFSVFKRDEFEYPENLSRDELILWCEHFKLLIKEINDELCLEINNLSQRNEILENYIEIKGLPFPEDDEEFNNKNGGEMLKILRINDLPHPLPSMNFIDNLDEYNPTKQQLKDYIDLMFNEWRRDEMDSNQMLLTTFSDKLLLKELEEDGEEKKEEEKEKEKEEKPKEDKESNEKIEKLQKSLDAAYLKQEEIELELNKKIKELTESVDQLQKQIRLEQQKNKKPKDPSEITGSLAPQTSEECVDDEIDEILAEEVGDKEEQLLLNRLNDTEQYVKDLQDEMKQLEFETAQQKQAIEREYKYQIELINIDLEESRIQCEDLQRQIGSDDLNLLASEFRNELWDARNDNNELKKKHIEEIRQLERDRDELLREINLLRIKTDRMDQNTDEVVAKMQIELDKKDKELQHFIQVTSNLSHVRDTMDTMQADRDELEKSYQCLQENTEKEQQIFQQDIKKLNIEKKKLIIRIKTAEQDIKSLKQSQGIDSNTIITKTELVKMKEEMDNLKIKRNEAIKSKIKLLQTSSLEIERMRDEIKLLTGDRKISMRDFKPGRYDSSSFHIINNNKLLQQNNNRLSMRSISSLGSSIPLHSGSTHQQILNEEGNNENNESYMGSAWTYTLGMLSSIGSIFGGNNQNMMNNMNNMNQNNQNNMNNMMMNNNNDYIDPEQYDVHTDYDGSRRSSVSGVGHPINNIYGYPDNNYNNNRSFPSQQHQQQQQQHQQHQQQQQQRHHHQKKHSRHGSSRNKLNRYQSTPYNQHYANQASMAGSYADYEVHHNRGLSAVALRAKRNKQSLAASHERKTSRHRTYSNMSSSGNMGGGGHHGVHRSKQPSKQEVLLESTDNENIRDSMAKIFDAFEQAEDNVDDAINMYNLDDMVNNHEEDEEDDDDDDDNQQQQQQKKEKKRNNHKRTSSSYHSDYMRKPLTMNEEEEEDDDVDDDDDDDDNNNNMNMMNINNMNMNDLQYMIQDDDEDENDTLLTNNIGDMDNLINYSSFDKVINSTQNNDDFWNTNINQDDHHQNNHQNQNHHHDDDDNDNIDNQYFDDDQMDFTSSIQSL